MNCLAHTRASRILIIKGGATGADQEEETEMINPIKKYVVRVPGNTAWSEHRSEKAALREARNANRVCRPGHRVYAEHVNGDVTGPYDGKNWDKSN